MNARGELRSASEFKDVYDATGQSFGPYCCPFCEAPFVDRCIVKPCVKAPHFKFPNGTWHREGCTGEDGVLALATVEELSQKHRRRVVGDVGLPEALVRRRGARVVRMPGDYGQGKPPDSAEIERRRELVAADPTLSSRFTASMLRPIAQAYLTLMEKARKQAGAANHRQGSLEYKATFFATLDACSLLLYEQKLTYRTAFRGFKVPPLDAKRIYHGSGTVRLELDRLIIRDAHTWPKNRGADAVAFEVSIQRTLLPNAPTSHLAALDELLRLSQSGQRVNWFAYGLPRLEVAGYELAVETIDHFFCI